MMRTVLVLPNGAQLEDLMIGNLKTYVKTQNIIIGHILEIIAREKMLENYIDQLLGEMGIDKEGKVKKVEEMLKEEFLFIYGEKKKLKNTSSQRKKKRRKRRLKCLNFSKKF